MIRAISARLLLLVLAAMILAGCGARPEIVAQVGGQAISREDVAYRQETATVRSSEPFPAQLALLQLIQEALMAEVGRSYGVVVSPEMLADEAARVQAESRDPTALAGIQAVFGRDEQAYRRLVLAPILVSQLLQARFSLGHDIQAEPLARAEEALQAAHSDGASLPALAERYGGDYRLLQVSDGQIQFGFEQNAAGDEQAPEPPAELAQYGVAPADNDGAFVAQVLAGLEVGEVHPQVVEDRGTFMVVRLLSREGAEATLEIIVFAKLAFDSWFQTLSQRVPLEIHDQALQEALLADVGLPYITGRLAAEK